MLTFSLAVFGLFKFKVTLESGLLFKKVHAFDGSVYEDNVKSFGKINATLNFNNAKTAKPNVNIYGILKNRKNSSFKI